MFVIDNGADGFSLHRMDTWERLRVFPTGFPLKRRPKHVIFGEDDGIIIGGSDRGSVFVFDRKTGEPLELLRHSPSGLIQAVAVSRRQQSA